MKVALEIIKVLVLLIGTYFILQYVTNNNSQKIQKKLDKIETNSNQIDSIFNTVKLIKEQKAQIINNIDRRTTIINKQKDELTKPLPKDTNIHNAINFLHEFAK
jgi:Tfp pilus assembly protein PilO